MDRAHLEKDVGGVEVAVADALCMHVRHACGDVLHHTHEVLPPLLQVARGKHPLGDEGAQGASIAKLLYTSCMALMHALYTLSPQVPAGRP